MGKIKSDKLHVQGIEVGIYTEDYRNEFISLTDIARYRNTDDPRFAIQNWMRNRNTIEFLGLWECLHNPAFNRVQFDTFKTEAGLNRFVMTPSKWVELTGAVGIVTKAGRYGGGAVAGAEPRPQGQHPRPRVAAAAAGASQHGVVQRPAHRAEASARRATAGPAPDGREAAAGAGVYRRHSPPAASRREMKNNTI